MTVRSPNAGMALLMALLVQWVLVGLGMAAFSESLWQQKMVANAWQMNSDRLRAHQAFAQLETQLSLGSLQPVHASNLGLAPQDCALAGWLSRATETALWRPWVSEVGMETHYVLIEWTAPHCSVHDDQSKAYTLVLEARFTHRPMMRIQAMWITQPWQRVYWRVDDSV